jgi:large subunit ribosomal protein L10
VIRHCGGQRANNWRRSVDRTDKEDLVASLHQTFEDASMVVVTHYSGLTVKEMGDLRGRMREAGALFKVTKNRLTRLALKDTKFEPLSDMFTGPTAIAYSDDPVAAAKVAVNYAKENDKLIVLGGALDNETLDANGVKALATLPSLDELRGKIIGLLNAPATKIAGVLQAPGGQVARVISAHAEQG